MLNYQRVKQLTMPVIFSCGFMGHLMCLTTWNAVSAFDPSFKTGTPHQMTTYYDPTVFPWF